MHTDIQDLGGLQRRVDLTVAASDIEAEVAQRLSRMARQASVPGFRRGKVPLKMVAASYGSQVQAEVVREKLGSELSSALGSSKLRLAGVPRLEPKPSDSGGELSFSATFEVYPQIDLGDVSGVEVQRYTCAVADADVDSTVEVIRRQRAKRSPVDRPAVDGDRVTVDFRGTVDGQPFEGGEAKDFSMTLGQGRMLPDFENAVRSMSVGQEKSFPLRFPPDYPVSRLAGVQAEFHLTVKLVEQAELPAVDAEFARALGVADGDLGRMRTELRGNLEREVQARLRARTRDSVLGALEQTIRFEVPQALVDEELQRMRTAMAGAAGSADAQPAQAELVESARKRVRLGLLVAELISRHRLQPRQEQIRAAVESIAQSYEKPSEVIQWYLGNRERLAEVEEGLAQDNLVAWAMQNARATERALSFDELMGVRP
jgi:trigger factor